MEIPAVDTMESQMALYLESRCFLEMVKQLEDLMDLLEVVRWVHYWAVKKDVMQQVDDLENNKEQESVEQWTE